MTAPRLRSQRWFGGTDLNGFLHRAWIKAEGFSEDAFQGRPVIGIANSWSEATNCNAHLRTVAEHVKRGVWRAASRGQALTSIQARSAQRAECMEVKA